MRVTSPAPHPRRTRVLATASALAVGVVTMLPMQMAQAETYPNWLCNVSVNSWVMQTKGGGGHLYTIPAGGGFRLYSRSDGYFWGHGNGRATGYVKDDPGRLYNCRANNG